MKQLVAKDKVKFAMSVVLEVFLLGMLGFLIAELVRRMATDVEDETILKWIPIYGILGVSLLSGWVGVVMARKIFMRKEIEVTSIARR